MYEAVMGFWTEETLNRLFPSFEEGRFVRTRLGLLWVIRCQGDCWGRHTYNVGSVWNLEPQQAVELLNLVAAYPPKERKETLEDASAVNE